MLSNYCSPNATPIPHPSPPHPRQDPLFAPNYRLDVAGFRELTSRRMAAFVKQRFFSVFDYVRDPLKFQVRFTLSVC